MMAFPTYGFEDASIAKLVPARIFVEPAQFFSRGHPFSIAGRLHDLYGVWRTLCSQGNLADSAARSYQQVIL